MSHLNARRFHNGCDVSSLLRGRINGKKGEVVAPPNSTNKQTKNKKLE